MADFGPALGKMGKASPLEPDMGGDEKVYSEQKEAVAKEAASALGIDPESIDAMAFCNALKKLIELE
jgi:hypothetical protein